MPITVCSDVCGVAHLVGVSRRFVSSDFSEPAKSENTTVVERSVPAASFAVGGKCRGATARAGM